MLTPLILDAAVSPNVELIDGKLICDEFPLPDEYEPPVNVPSIVFNNPVLLPDTKLITAMIITIKKLSGDLPPPPPDLLGPENLPLSPTEPVPATSLLNTLFPGPLTSLS